MVTLTESAREYLKGVGKPNVYLSVKGGGCSGFTYVWDTTEEDASLKMKSMMRDMLGAMKEFSNE